MKCTLPIDAKIVDKGKLNEKAVCIACFTILIGRMYG